MPHEVDDHFISIFSQKPPDASRVWYVVFEPGVISGISGFYGYYLTRANALLFSYVAFVMM